MANIGSFKKVGSDFQGEIVTLSVRAKGVRYLSLKLDDPSFTAPIFANLFDDEDGEGYSLICSRSGGKANGERAGTWRRGPAPACGRSWPLSALCSRWVTTRFMDEDAPLPSLPRATRRSQG